MLKSSACIFVSKKIKKNKLLSLFNYWFIANIYSIP
jgi:hypothetical protein